MTRSGSPDTGTAGEGTSRSIPRRPPVLRPVRGHVREPGSRALAAVVGLLEPVLRRTTRVQWSGLDHIPATGGVIIAANHLSYADPLVLAHFVVAAGRWPHFLGKASLFALPLLGRLITACEQIPVHRGTAQAADALVEAAAALTAGKLVIIYPEGTLTTDRDGWPTAPRSGVIRLARSTGAPIIPVAQWGAQRILAPGGLLPRVWPPTPVQVVAGRPVDLIADGAGRTAEPGAEAERVMSQITTLLSGLRGVDPPQRPAQPGTTTSPRGELSR